MLTPARRSRHAGHEGSLETLLCTRMSGASLLARAIAALSLPCPATDGLQSCVLAQEWPGVSCAEHPRAFCHNASSQRKDGWQAAPASASPAHTPPHKRSTFLCWHQPILQHGLRTGPIRQSVAALT